MPTSRPAPMPGPPAAFGHDRCHDRAGERRARALPLSGDTEGLAGPLDVFTPASAPHTAQRRPRPPVAVPVTPAPPAPFPVAVATAAPHPAGDVPCTKPGDAPELPAVPTTGARAPVPQASAAGDCVPDFARLDAVPIGLPALMRELLAIGRLTPGRRDLWMNRFRADRRGTLPDRERRVLAGLSAELGLDLLRYAARAAASRQLGVLVPVLPPAPPHRAAA
jgi:hypothetical protein